VIGKLFGIVLSW